MNRVVQMSQWPGENDPLAMEEQLRNQIAYYKARLADIQKAPKGSRHREGWTNVASRLEESQYQLARLRSRLGRSSGRV